MFEEWGVVILDVMLFEVVFVGISDYYVNMNMSVLIYYIEEG